MLQRCTGTGQFFYPPAPVSPFTGRPQWEWQDVSGEGGIWSFVTFYKKYFAGFAADVPYDVAMIKLDEGPFLLTNIVDAGGKPTAIGQRVAVTFQQRQGDLVVPQFAPVEASS
jgi:uncharacterized OB-fold protein